ncbi:GNAT family N-acetyltransferase [Aquimarina algiphila]|uniref:GNAT family N-acetyltransferase n=1 Tax=Aquimarina algiphila TaxID=2047982 RepID=UPI00233019FD|nr:GNAT family N-acetyltransferase [Aquimarina algiphila]
MNTKLDYSIRRLKETDLHQVAELYSLFWDDAMNLTKMKEVFKRVSKDSQYIFLGAEMNGEIIGTIQGVICEELYGACKPFLVMENFVVSKEHRGKGIGKSLLSELENNAKKRECSQMIFLTESDRSDTIKFYEKLGFDSSTHKGFKKSL